MSSLPSASVVENGAATSRTAVRLTGLALLSLSFQTLGIIYSDIGTSPLYVLNGIWASDGPVPSKEDVIGSISAILWSLTLLPLVKYVFISLHFGTSEGEGGTFALYQGLFPRAKEDPDSDRVLTGGSTDPTAKSEWSSIPRLSKHLKWPLLIWCLFGTSLTMADGILTPAVSVTSAMGGMAVAKPSVSSDVIPISIAFLVVLFLAQPFGTAKISYVFAPITCIWLLLLVATGIVNIVSYPGIFRAVDPSRAILWFVRTKNFDALSGVLLALTGCEAMFANLGQFNMLSIQLSFSLFVYPSICIAYLGQGARLISDGESVLSNVFYQTIPGSNNGPLFWIVYVFAILATLTASQAMISATFSLTQQIVNLRCLPPLRIRYTSDTIQGQIFVPSANWLLMIATIVVVAAFKSSTALTHAYGFAVATVMISTTVLIAIQMRYVKYWPALIAVAFFIAFGFLDGLFWGASLRKVPDGAWVPLMIGAVLMVIMVFWTWAKGLEDEFDGTNRRNLRHFIVPGEAGEIALHVGNAHGYQEDNAIASEEDRGLSPIPHEYYYMADPDKGNSFNDFPDEERRQLVRIPTCAIFHKLSSGKGVPHSFVGFVRQWPALPRVVIFLSVRMRPIAHVHPNDKYIVTKVYAVEGFYAVTYALGFREDFEVKVEEIVSRICAVEARTNPEGSSYTVDTIKQYASTATHIVPHYYVMSKKIDGGIASKAVHWIRAFLIESLYRPLASMFPETENWMCSSDEIIRVGVTATI
ncbi:potassium transporter [Punctularia strigosozonata HHB-11173 SS5]|uniref:potassium transporter n=1 Tax=Punctularia strigosozonata (strain HHB-11173) TaxID=741275 RepID=UPI0004417AD2|nr:potassium transporter [Punctularia strigosozonata HHB-11173 SS5]EIN06328.1 potassium transporter [Punctularia strigosozonata HHB-11173 SS5]